MRCTDEIFATKKDEKTETEEVKKKKKNMLV
jgi:hypothetical protein